MREPTDDTGGPDDVRERLGRAATLSAAEAVEILQEDQLARWDRGERVPAEAYLQLHPALAAGATEALDLVYAELLLRRQRGEAPPLAEYEWRFPRLADQLRLLAELDEGLACTTPGPNDTPVPDLTSAHRPAGLGRLGRFELWEQVGRGGFATMYRAWDPELGREVAVKVLRADSLAEAGARLRREASSAARLRHPAIVPLHEVGQDGDAAYLVYEFIRGPSLARLMRSTRPAPELAAQWVARLADALDYAHTCGVVHRDVKPANVLLDPDGRPLLTDFGLALQAEAATLTQPGDVLGTPAYMSPEQAAGRGHEVDARTDVYSLGVVLYELLCGQPPFAGSAVSVLHHILHTEPPAPRQRRPGLPADLETVCLKAMAKEPGRRYPTARRLADDLRRYLERRPIHARRTGPLSRLALACRRRPAVAITVTVAAAVSLATAGLGVWGIVRERDLYRAEREQAVSHLYQSLVGEARALRLARANGFRDEAWRRLAQALSLETPVRDPVALRQEAVAAMGDFVGLPPTTWYRPQGQLWVVAAAFEPASGQVAVGLTDGTIRLRAFPDGTETECLLGHAAGVYALAFAPDGALLVSADDGGAVKVWRRPPGASWQCTLTLPIPPADPPNRVNAASLALTPDGRRLLACARGAPAVSVWNVMSGAPDKAFTGPRGEALRHINLSRDGRWLAAAFRSDGQDGVLVWDAADGQLLHTLAPGLRTVNHVIFGPDGRHLACAGEDGVALFDTADFQARLFLRCDDPDTVAFHPDGQRLAVPLPSLGVTILWDVAANRQTAALRHDDEPHTALFRPDGSALLAVSANTIRIWDPRGAGDKLILKGHAGAVASVAFRPDGRLLASAGHDRAVKLWDLDSGRPLAALTGFQVPVVAVAFSPDSRLLATRDRAALRVWDVTEPHRPRDRGTLDPDLGSDLRAIAFSPDGRLLAVGAADGVRVWRREPGAADDPGRSFVRHTRLCGPPPDSLAFSPDGRQLAWRVANENVSIWDVASDPPRLRATYDTRGPDSSDDVAFFPDGRHLMLINGNREAEALDAATGRRAFTLGRVDLPDQRNWYMGRGFALHPRGTLLAVQSWEVPVWDVRTRSRLFSLPREPGTPMCLTWDPSGDRLAIGTADGGLVVWNLPAIRAQLAPVGLAWD
jgi:WD40 repeat protein